MPTLIRKNMNGFSLIEVAIVLLIIGFLLGAIITPMSAQRETNNIKQARAELKMIEEALYGYVIANARFPCPAQPGSGAESDPGGNCSTRSRGFVPSVTLGITGRTNCDGLMLDPWGNPYRYSVTRSNARAFTTDIPAVGIAGLTPNLRVCSDATQCNATTLTPEAVAVIYSMGSGWNTMGGVDETENGEANTASTCGLAAYRRSNDNRYVHKQRIEAGANQYNDILIWISPNILYAKLVTAGVL